MATTNDTRDGLAKEAGIGRRTMQRADKVNEHGAKAVKKREFSKKPGQVASRRDRQNDR
jgi:hypothetical protein